MDVLRQRGTMKSQLGPAGPSNVQGMAPPGQPRRPGQHPHTMQQTPQQQQQQMQQQQMQMQQQQQMQRIKRSSTSPGEEVPFRSLSRSSMCSNCKLDSMARFRIMKARLQIGIGNGSVALLHSWNRPHPWALGLAIHIPHNSNRVYQAGHKR
jgi:hypothetical protein